MKLPASYRKMRLRKGKERGFTNRHPWIFSGAFESSDREGVAGETVEIYDHNGKYLATGHFNPGTIMVRLFSYKRVIADTLFWEGKIRSAIKLRETLGLLDDSTDSLRVVHAEGDHLPGLIVDKYGEHLVMQCFSPGMNNESDSIAEAMDKCFKPETIYLKRSTAAAESKWIKGDQSETIILENGIRFRVNWERGQKTGFYTDQRQNRSLLSTYSDRKRILNLYSYSGGFSLYGLCHGASFVHSVDSSEFAIELCKENVSMNAAVKSAHQSFCSDVPEYIRSSDLEYDIIILDPPAFAKHLDSKKQALIGYRKLNHLVFSRIPEGSLMFTFSCSQIVDKQEFRKVIFKAASDAGRQVQVLHQLSQGPDHPVSIYHPEGEYLKGLVLHVT